MTGHDYWDELAAGYALHGLAPDEELAFTTHLETCADCAANTREHELVAAQLGSIAHYRETEGEPPSWASMRARIIDDEAVDPAPVADLGERRRRYNRTSRILAAAAAVVLLVGGGIATWQLTTSSAGSACVASSSCHTIKLDAAGGQTAASLVVRGDHVTMDTSGMSAAPAGKAYVLWQLRKDSPAVPIKAFDVQPGSPAVQARLMSSYADTTGFAVSLENAGSLPAQPHNELAQGVAT